MLAFAVAGHHNLIFRLLFSLAASATSASSASATSASSASASSASATSATATTAASSKHESETPENRLCSIYQVSNFTVDQLSRLQHQDDVWFASRRQAHIRVCSADPALSNRPSPHTRMDKEVDADRSNWRWKLLQRQPQESFPTLRGNRQPREVEASLLGRYATYRQVVDWQKSLAGAFPEVVTLLEIGKSFENRSLYVTKVGAEPRHRMRAGDVYRKKAVFVEATMHGRELVATHTAIYFLTQLLKNVEDMRALLLQLDVYILPIANPDGHEYTTSTKRLWRKNRRPVDDCVGIDLNRNWNSGWKAGTSSLGACAVDYPGERPESEPEVISIRRFVATLPVKTSLSLHSYSQMWLLPWARSSDTPPPPHHSQSLELAERAAAAQQRVHGKQYQVGVASDILYPFTGGFLDFMIDKVGVKYSYLLELRDKGKHGFVLPEHELIPTGEEAWAGFMVLLRQTAEEFPAELLPSAAVRDDDSPNVAAAEPNRWRPLAYLLLFCFSSASLRCLFAAGD